MITRNIKFNGVEGTVSGGRGNSVGFGVRVGKPFASRASLPSISAPRQVVLPNSRLSMGLYDGGHTTDTPLLNLRIAVDRTTGARQTIKKLGEELDFRLMHSSLYDSIESTVTELPGISRSSVQSVSSKCTSPVKPLPIQRSALYVASKKPVLKDVKVPLRSISPDGEQVEIIQIDSLHHFIVKVKSADSEYMSLLKNIKAAADGSAADQQDRIVIGQHMLGRWEDDQQWYRVEIAEEIKPGELYKVFFMDEGNTDNVAASFLRSLPTHCAHLPRLAVACTMENVPSNKLVDTRMLLLRENGVARAYRLTDEHTDTAQRVRLQLANGDWIDSLLNMRTISERSLDDIQTEDVHLPLPFTSCQRFMVQRLAIYESYGALFEKLQGYGQSALPLDANSYHFIVGNYMLARWTDNCWYRVQLLEQLPNGWRVLFVDEGNEDVVANSELRSLHLEFTELPQVATMCALEDFEEVVEPTFCEEIARLLEEAKGVARITHCSTQRLPPHGRLLVKVEMKIGDVNVGSRLADIRNHEQLEQKRDPQKAFACVKASATIDAFCSTRRIRTCCYLNS